MSFERKDWGYRPSWRCEECGATWAEAFKERGRAPWNQNQKTCDAECARARKTRLQLERRSSSREKPKAVPRRRGPHRWDPIQGRWIDAEEWLEGYVDVDRRPPGGWPPRVRGQEAERSRSFVSFGKAKVYLVPPARFASSTLGAPEDGDIELAHSCGAICDASMRMPPRVPGVKCFDHDGARWTVVGSVSKGPFVYYAEAYRLAPTTAKRRGKATTRGSGYTEQLVTFRGRRFVLTSRAYFVPDNVPPARPGTSWA